MCCVHCIALYRGFEGNQRRIKLNQREFAELVGLKASYYYQMEKGNRRPSRKVYQQIMDAVNTNQSTNFT
ncbi:MAG: helix-turn-helix domain-containing protein [Enterocloster sp.]